MKTRLIKGLFIIFSLMMFLTFFSPNEPAYASDTDARFELSLHLAIGDKEFSPTVITSLLDNQKYGVDGTAVPYSEFFANSVTSSEASINYLKLFTLPFDYNNGLYASRNEGVSALADIMDISYANADAQFDNLVLPSDTYKGYSVDIDALNKALAGSDTATRAPTSEDNPSEVKYTLSKPFYFSAIRNTGQTTITYIMEDGTNAPKTRTVSGNSTQPAITIPSPDKPGYTVNKKQVIVTFDTNHAVTVTYTKSNTNPQPVVTNQSSLAADPTATITAGQPVTAETFNAKATDASGREIPVTLDTSQLKREVPGTYPITLTAANGKSLSVSLTVKAAPATQASAYPGAVYGSKTLYLYSQPTFKKTQRIAKYPKAKRTQRPIFTVTGQAYSSAGRLRYAVRDVNNGSATYGKTGYITTKASFVTAAYYQKAVDQVKVINAKGINAYRNQALTQKVTHVARGKVLKVTGITHYRQTTRLQLANGQYITGNKTLVMAVGK